MQRALKRVSDGFVNLSGGTDSGKNPTLATEISPDGLQRNQVSFAINCTMRGGRIKPRPGYKKLDVERVEGRFQGAEIFKADNDPGCIIASIDGNIWRYNVGSDNSVQNITISGDANPSILPQAWMFQAENFLIIQDGQSKPLIYNGGALRRAGPREIPCGTVGTYGMGRIWQTLPNQTTFVAGDLVYSVTGSRDDVLGFTENTFLNEGGAFSVPSNAGQINAMRFLVNLDTSLGQGPLQVFTSNTIFSVNTPVDRTTWKNLQYPIQTVSMVSYGASSQNSTVLVNGDAFYRAPDGVRSFRIARRDIDQWGNTPLSREMNRVIEKDDPNLISSASATLFDNRLLMTCSPVRSNYGTYHRGLMSLDFDLISSMGRKLPPAWEGLWTGINVLQILKGTIGGIERCFMFVLNGDNEIELWEVTLNSRFDLIPEEKPITWSFEGASFPFGDIFGLKRLETGDIWIDQVAGNVNFTLMYRPDQNPCWKPWTEWDECAKYQDCDITECHTPKTFKAQYRAKRRFIQPNDDCDSLTGKLFRDGYEFQPRLEITGYCEVKQMRLHAMIRDEPIAGECPT